ncbi:MAG TPA: Zn-dependent alcohol dehydrogenase [Hyphomicrobiaceae bacterium]|jgi:S-(hydroxymethyl)glutathione dehydrogenase/alcohol dehydrogenase|nr:Zn-dependent alcohol dehydrogenase [Hyphomicrobiaceae bacterium]
MRAAVLTAVNKPLELLDLEQEGPKAGEVRVQVKAAGVCMSDWHIMNGDWPLPLPMVLGHEAAGVVVELGPEVHNVRIGDHVIFSFRPHCGRCSYCSKGRTVLCSGRNDTPRWLMHDGTARVRLNGEPVNQMARIGTFSEAVVCPAEQVVKVREDLPWTHAAIIGCSVATGVGAVVRHAEVEAGASVLVIGCGGVGLNVVQGARLAGAGTIIACDLLDNKLDYAREFGATHTVNAKTEDALKRVRELTGGLGVDYAFDAIGGDVTAKLAVDAVAPGGHAVLVGIPAMSTTASISPFQIVYGEKKITGTYYGSIRPTVDFGVLADLDMAKRINLDALISRTYTFDEINEGFRLLTSGQVARGVIVF